MLNRSRESNKAQLEGEIKIRRLLAEVCGEIQRQLIYKGFDDESHFNMDFDPSKGELEVWGLGSIKLKVER